jgi:hypothetical protein
MLVVVLAVPVPGLVPELRPGLAGAQAASPRIQDPAIDAFANTGNRSVTHDAHIAPALPAGNGAPRCAA